MLNSVFPSWCLLKHSHLSSQESKPLLIGNLSVCTCTQQFASLDCCQWFSLVARNCFPRMAVLCHIGGLWHSRLLIDRSFFVKKCLWYVWGSHRHLWQSSDAKNVFMLYWFGAYREAEDVSRLRYAVGPWRGNRLLQTQEGWLAVMSDLEPPNLE